MRQIFRKYSQIFKRKKEGPPRVDKTKDEARSDNAGLKLLYNGDLAKIDIIAVHGLNGHRERSWTATNGMNWLEKLITKDIPDSRVYSWGYDMPSDGVSEVPAFQTISERLAEDIREMKDVDGTHSRPIIFIAHSQGGTVVKSAILHSLSEKPSHGETSTTENPNKALTIQGVVFLGTPELDSRLSGLKSYVSLLEGSPEQQNAEFKEAQWMISVFERYSLVADEFRTVYAYESLQCNDLDKKPQSSSFQRLSPHILIHDTHEGMVKFESPSDDGYVKVKDVLLDMTRDDPI